MSFVKPSEYKTVADQLGIGYALIRDAINDNAGAGASINMSSATETITDADDGFSGSSSDPVGSIMNDLGSVWFKANNNNFTVQEAKTIAANRFASALRKLNNHVIQRLGQTNISTFYSTYAAISGDLSMSLFGDPSSASYFTAEFAELSLQVGVTIDSTYVA